MALVDAHVLAFAGLSALLTITPGPDMAFVGSVALSRGRRAAGFGALGVVSGLALHAAAAALGLSALLLHWAGAFTFLKWAGGAYLVCLGALAVWRARRPGLVTPAVTRSGEDSSSASGALAFRQGFVTNALNPKVAVFYLTLIPQFVSPGDPLLAKSLLLAGIHAAWGLLWLPLYAFMLLRASALAARFDARAWLLRASGAALVALGARLVTLENPLSRA